MSISPTDSASTQTFIPTKRFNIDFPNILLVKGMPDPRFIPKSAPIKSPVEFPTIFKNIPNIEKLWPIIRDIPGGAKWLAGILTEAVVVVAEGVTLAQAIAVGSLASGILALFAQPAGSKDEFPNINGFLKNVDAKLLTQFSKLITSKNISIEQALTLFKGAKPENVAKAMEEIIALSGDPAWKKTPATRQKKLIELRQLLPSLSDKKGRLSDAALLLLLGTNHVMEPELTVFKDRKDKSLSCNADGTIINELTARFNGSRKPENLDGFIHIQKVELNLSGYIGSEPTPVRILKYNLTDYNKNYSIQDYLHKNSRFTHPEITDGIGQIRTDFILDMKTTTLIRPQCLSGGVWIEAEKKVRNRTSDYPNHSRVIDKSTPIGVQLQRARF